MRSRALSLSLSLILYGVSLGGFGMWFGLGPRGTRGSLPRGMLIYTADSGICRSGLGQQGLSLWRYLPERAIVPRCTMSRCYPGFAPCYTEHYPCRRNTEIHPIRCLCLGLRCFEDTESGVSADIENEIQIIPLSLLFLFQLQIDT